MPLGPSVLLNSDVTRMIRLKERPKNVTYQSESGEFLEPKFSVEDWLLTLKIL